MVMEFLGYLKLRETKLNTTLTPKPIIELLCHLYTHTFKKLYCKSSCNSSTFVVYVRLNGILQNYFSKQTSVGSKFYTDMPRRCFKFMLFWIWKSSLKFFIVETYTVVIHKTFSFTIKRPNCLMQANLVRCIMWDVSKSNTCQLE